MSLRTHAPPATRFNPHAPRGARQKRTVSSGLPSEFQSARPARGATLNAKPLAGSVIVSIRTPREGRDPDRQLYATTYNRFNPHAPRGARLSDPVKHRDFKRVSIRTPREGRDPPARLVVNCHPLFQSARPARGATFGHFRLGKQFIVSIRTPREGRDITQVRSVRVMVCFNPHAPRGARPPDLGISTHG